GIISCTGTVSIKVSPIFGEKGDLGAVTLLLTDFPLNNANVTQVNVNFSKIEIHSETRGWETVVDYGKEGRSFDLLTLQNGVTDELGSFSLKTGVYTQIRLYLNDTNEIVVNRNGVAVSEPLKVPSGVQTGIKLNRSFEVAAQGVTTFTVDFDAQKSISHNKGQGYLLKPVIKIIDAKTDQGAGQTVSAENGGSVSILSEISVDVPAGALNTDTQIEIVPVATAMPDTLSSITMLSNRYELLPDGIQFNSDITITMNYDPKEVTGLKLNENALEIYYFDPGRNSWVSISSTVDIASNTVTAQTNHFTQFGVGASSPPGVPIINPAEIVYTVDPVFNVTTQIPDNILADIKEADVQDKVASVTVFYRIAGAGAYQTCNQPITPKKFIKKYTCLILAGYVTGDITTQTFEVYIEATDLAGNVAYAPPTAGSGVVHSYTYNPDVDGDGINDRWEALYGLNPGDPADGSIDLDLDGLSNLQEYQTGTDPNVPNNILLAPTGVTVINSGAQNSLSWNVVAGATSYNVYWSTTAGVTPVTGTKISNAASPYNHTGLIDGTTYYYIVTAFDGVIESQPSAEVSVTFTQPKIYFTATGSMTMPRIFHTATLMPNGKVLITGGNNHQGTPKNPSPAGDSAEIYNPATGTFSATGMMNARRIYHTATLMANGKILIVGGHDGVPIAMAEIYDPATGTFSPTGSLNFGRYHHRATLLTDGKVLITGGMQNPSTATAEIYDPVAGTFSATEPMKSPRTGHTATLLSSGKVLITGGRVLNPKLASGEIYDPTMGTFKPTGNMNLARSSHTATLLSNGKVLMTGGNYGASEIFDPVTRTFTTTGILNLPTTFHTATLILNGMVLVTGGSDGQKAVNSTELYDPLTGNYATTGLLNSARNYHMATLLPNGMILITGGISFYGTIIGTAELFE
ncbi:MAG: DUF4382 domain-containing protein, partial [Leptospirales bacterium]